METAVETPTELTEDALNEGIKNDPPTEVEADDGTVEGKSSGSDEEAKTVHQSDTDAVDGEDLISGASEKDLDNAQDKESKQVESPVNSLFTINKKRQEEKAVFQKLIDDITALESSLSQKQSAFDELKMKLDVCVIDLENERGKSEDSKEKVRDLEKHLMEAQKKIAAMKRAEMAANSGEDNLAVSDVSHEEIQELHMKVKKLTQEDELKVRRVGHLEEELQQNNRLISLLEAEVGKERVDSLRQHGNSNGTAHAGIEGRARVRDNEVNPNTQQSKVCIIL
ncbi:putative leucine-rich repeat-containing protein DDB_G0290503 isoform X2 [Watersipora subatra]|uniref:putative leucine-rich repeat-containing protein DDB_G0290503 isoform X2 n=1 Tax=Watersipora subatra TaxID=2589382 RepID=UPI00355C9BC2